MHSNGLIASKHTYGSRSLEKRSLEVHQGEQLILTQKKISESNRKTIFYFTLLFFEWSGHGVWNFGHLHFICIQSSHWKAKKKCQKGETVDGLLIFVSSQKMEREAKRVKKVLIIGCRQTFLLCWLLLSNTIVQQIHSEKSNDAILKIPILDSQKIKRKVLFKTPKLNVTTLLAFPSLHLVQVYFYSSLLTVILLLIAKKVYFVRMRRVSLQMQCSFFRALLQIRN